MLSMDSNADKLKVMIFKISVVVPPGRYLYTLLQYLT